MTTLLRSPIWFDPRVKPPRGAVELDPLHPLARGMVGCWIDAEPIVEDYSPRANTATRVNAPTFVPGPGGLAHSFAGTDQRLLTIRAKSDDLTGALTVAQGVQPRGSFVNFRNTIFRGDTAAGQIGIIVFGDAHWEAEFVSGGGVTGSTLVLNKDASLAYTLTGAGGTAQTYTDGRPNNSGAGRTASFKDADLTIGADVPNGRWWNGLIYYTYLYNRALSASEVAWLHAEPYAMFRPAGVRRRFLVIPPITTTRDAQLPLEFQGLSALLRDAQLPLEFQGLSALLRDAQLPLEFQGLSALLRDAQLPLEFQGLSALLRDAQLPLTFSGALLRAAQLPVDWRGAMVPPRSAGLPIAFTGIDPDLLLHRWLVLVKLNTPLLHAWTVHALAQTFALPHQWAVKERLPALPHRWNVTGDLLTPFGVSPETGEPLPAVGAGPAPGDVQQPVATKDKTP